MKHSIFLLLLIAGALRAEIGIVAHPGVDCSAGTTTVWTGAMQAAFDRMLGAKSSMTLERVVPPNPLVDKMAGFSWKESAVLPKDGWFAVTGDASEKLVDEANQKWQVLAGAGPLPFKYNGSSGGRAAYVGMKRDFLFKLAFSPSGASRLSWGPEKTPVRFFGARGGVAGDYSESVRVLAYRPIERCMALQLLAKMGDDTLVLYQPAEAQPMIEAMRWVKTWRQGWDKHEGENLDWNDKVLHQMDDLRVPEISLKGHADFGNDFKGEYLFKDAKLPYRVTQAATDMKLEVDGVGVKFEATAEMDVLAFGSSERKSPVPRKFWFDRPFFAFLWRDGAEWPYAAVWFGTAEGLVK
jgi:hypothetical protein